MKHVVCSQVPQKFVAYFLSKGGYKESDLTFVRLSRGKVTLLGSIVQEIGEFEIRVGLSSLRIQNTSLQHVRLFMMMLSCSKKCAVKLHFRTVMSVILLKPKPHFSTVNVAKMGQSFTSISSSRRCSK